MLCVYVVKKRLPTRKLVELSPLISFLFLKIAPNNVTISPDNALLLYDIVMSSSDIVFISHHEDFILHNMV